MNLLEKPGTGERFLLCVVFFSPLFLLKSQDTRQSDDVLCVFPGAEGVSRRGEWHLSYANGCLSFTYFMEDDQT